MSIHISRKKRRMSERYTTKEVQKSICMDVWWSYMSIPNTSIVQTKHISFHDNTQTNVASSNNHRCANVDIYHPTTIHTNITSSNDYKKHVVSHNNTQNKAMSSSNSYLWTLPILGNYFQKRKFWTYQNKRGRYC